MDATDWAGLSSPRTAQRGAAHLFHKGNNEIVSAEKLPTCLIIRVSRPSEESHYYTPSEAMQVSLAFQSAKFSCMHCTMHYCMFVAAEWARPTDRPTNELTLTAKSQLVVLPPIIM